MLNELFLRHWVTVHGAMVLAGLTVYTIASHTLRQRRHPSAAIAWLISLVLLPYVALPLYLLIGSRKVISSRPGLAAPAAGKAHPGATATTFGQLSVAMGLPDAVAFERLRIHQDGTQALQALRAMLDSAQRTLDLCTFILGRDALGDEISQRLIACAHRGVKVRLMIDGIGFYMGGHPNLKRLRLAGVQVALFVSPLRSALRGRTNLRNHRKLVIVDDQWLWCGGRNLAADYFEGDPAWHHRTLPWVDLTFDVRGALVQQGVQRFEQDWVFATTGAIARPQRRAQSSTSLPALGARLVASGPDQKDDTLFTLLVSGCFTARARILAVTPYLVPEPTLLMALTLAARRGVAVDLLLPRKSNHVLADIARQAGLRELLSAGARIWLAPDMVHAKAVLIDDELALVGSANLDERSLFLNYELMVAFQEPSVVQDFAHWITVQRSSATPYRSQAPGLARELAEGLVRWLAFQL